MEFRKIFPKLFYGTRAPHFKPMPSRRWDYPVPITKSMALHKTKPWPIG